MKKLVTLAFTLCIMLSITMLIANAETVAATSVTINDITIYENAFGEMDKSVVEFRLSNGNGKKMVTVNGEELFYNLQKEVYVGLVPASSISDASITVQVAENAPTPFVYGNTDDEIDTENYNKSIDAADLQLIKLHVAGKKSLNGLYLISADLDRDGELTASDLQQMKLNIKTKREFDVLNTLNSETYVANTITTGSYSGVITIYDKYRNNTPQRNTIVIDSNDKSKTINIYDKDGNTTDTSILKKYSTLEVKSYKTSATTSVMDIWICNDQINGTVDSVADNTVVIDGTTYEISDYYKKYAIGNGLNETLKEKCKAFLHLDRRGKITHLYKDQSAYQYAYIYSISPYLVNSNPAYEIKYVDQSGKKDEIVIDYEIEYDGTRLSPTAGMQYLMNTASKTNYDKTTAEKESVYSQLIKYSKDSDEKFLTMATVNNLADEYTVDMLSATKLKYTQKEDGSYEPLTYKYITSTSGSFMSGARIDINSSTKVFVVGSKRSITTIKKSTVSKEFAGEEEYILELFDSKNNTANVCVVYKDEKPETVTADTPVYIIDEITATSTRNKAGEIGERADIFITKTTFDSDTLTSAEEGIFTGWGEGSVVKMLKNNWGDVKSEADGSVVIWDVTSPTMPEANEWINKEAKSVNGAYYRTLVGVIESFDPETGVITFIPSTDFDSINEESYTETFTINHSTVSMCGYVVYDPSYDIDPVYNITYEELEGNIITYEDDPENATEVLMHITGTQYNLIPHLIYIINR